MNLKFPRCMKAGRAADVSQWDLADALLKETEDQRKGPRGYEAVVKEFADHLGLDYSAEYLKILRTVAQVFPPNRRYDGEHNKPMVTLRGHQEATSPDMLDAIVKAAKKKDVPVTRPLIIKTLQQLRAQERAARADEHKAAQVELAEAEDEEHRAEKRRDNAKSDSERKAATEERDHARTRKAKAKRKVQESKVPPKRKLPAPQEDEEPDLLTRVRVSAAVSSIMGDSLRLKQDLVEFLGSGAASPAFVNAAIEQLIGCREELTRMIDLLRQHQKGGKAAHLYAIGE